MAQNDGPARNTTLSPNDQIFCLSTDDIRRTIFTVGPFAGLHNILGSPHSITLGHMVICACSVTTTLIPGLKNLTVPYLLTTAPQYLY